MWILLLASLLYGENFVPTLPEDNEDKIEIALDIKDPRVLDRIATADIYIYISDQKDFETDFVRTTLQIPDDILTGKLKSKYLGHLEKWLKLRRKLNYQIINDSTVVGQPLVAFTRNETPRILAYPYKACPDHTIFLEHLIYLNNISKVTRIENFIRTEYFEINSNFYDENGEHHINSIKFCVDSIFCDCSPLLDYNHFYYIKVGSKIISSNGPTIQEQLHLLDAGTGFLVK